MENSTNHLDPEQLYAQGVAHFRAARWVEAAAAFTELQSRSKDYPEVNGLLDDIQMKLGIDQRQAPTAAPTPRSTKPRNFGIAFGAIVMVALLGLGLRYIILTSLNMPLPTARQVIVGALPTAAPASAAEATTGTPVAGGALTVRTADGVELTNTIKNIYVILDASGSMLAQIGDRRKIDIAHEALGRLVQDLPEGTNIALRTYGRQRSDDCSDVELVSPLAPINKEALIAQINSIIPVNLSRTPIGASLSQIPTDLAGVTDETLVVLVSDGEENCDIDPVAVAGQIHGANSKVQISVVGFDISPDLQARLAAVAQAGGGSYYDAANVEQLGSALHEILRPEVQLLNADHQPVNNLQLGDVVDLPSGNYEILIGSGETAFQMPIEVRPEMTTIITLTQDQDRLNAEMSRDWTP